MKTGNQILLALSGTFLTVAYVANATAGQSVKFPTSYSYDLYSDPTQTTCTNNSTNISLTGPLTLTFPDLRVNVIFRQGAKRYASGASEAGVTVGTADTIANFKKTDKIGMGNPYISLKDNQSSSNDLLQLGRCVAASNNSVWNRPRVSGNQIAFLTATLNPNSCDSSNKTIQFGSQLDPLSATGTVFFSNKLLSTAPSPTEGVDNTNVPYGLTLAQPISVKKGGPIGSGATGGNPYVSMQIADCKLKRDRGSSPSETCEVDRQAQLFDARYGQYSSVPDTYFPYSHLDGNRNASFKDQRGDGWYDDRGVLIEGKKLSDFKLWGPILTTETEPKRCKQL